MTDWLGVALRFGVYADLLLLFGLAAYPLYAATPSRPLGGRPMIAGLAGLGVLLSALSFLQMVASMSGSRRARAAVFTLRLSATALMLRPRMVTAPPDMKGMRRGPMTLVPCVSVGGIRSMRLFKSASFQPQADW